MTRVLRRPMFRIGGVAEGITSGLDQTQLTASRPGYNRGRVVRPGGYAGEKEEYERMNKILQDIRGERKSQLPQFLMSMGLDLATRPRSGNIFQQIATSAKGPLDKWMETRAAREGVDDKLSAALLGDVMDVQARKELQEAKLASEERIALLEKEDPKVRDEFTWEAKFKKLTELKDQRRKLLEQIEETRLMGPDEINEQEKAETLESLNENILRLEDDIDVLDKGEEDWIAKMLASRDDLETLTKYQELKRRKHTMSREVYQRELDKLLYGEATGGRVGYQNAGSVMPSAMPNAMPSAMPVAMQAPGTTDQGQDDTVQDLSFEELRARLPQEITNDIVKLLSESKQALIDFANIRTQQDVNTFNQKYDVNLVVPQEV